MVQVLFRADYNLLETVPSFDICIISYYCSLQRQLKIQFFHGLATV